MDALALILSLVAIAFAFSAQRSIGALQTHLADALDRLRTLQAQVAGPRPAPPEPPPAEPARAPPPAEERAPAEPAPLSEEPSATAGPPPAEPDIPAAVAPAVPAAPHIPPTAPPAVPAALSLEERFGTRWAVWIGGLALMLGGVLLVRYSIEQGIFGPAVRIGIAAAFSLTLIAAGELFRRSERASPVQGIPTAHIPGILTAAGTIGAFATVYAAHALYQFIDTAAAFLMLGAIGIATMFAAALHGPALAGLGLAGALVTPLLVTSQQPNPWPLVIYLSVVAGAAYGLAHLRRWLWLAGATVAGAVLWGFALLVQLSSGIPGAWDSALLAHTGLQLALAAAFMAIEPHLATADPAAEPDWIATLALAAMTVLVIRALGATPTHAQWTVFAAAALAILAVTAWRSAPAAGAAVLAGIVVLATIAIWRGAVPDVFQLPENPSVISAVTAFATARALRVPAEIPSFLAFAGLASLSVCAVAALRVWRGRTLPTSTAGLYALAAVVPALLALVLAYLRVTQFGSSIPFALCAVFVAAVFYLVAHRFGRIAPADRTPATALALGAFASGVAAAMALAFVMVLDRGYLTVAFAITAFTTAIVAGAARIALLRYVVAAIGLIVAGRLAWNPLIMGAEVGTWPILNWLLVGYGVPAFAFLAAGHILKRDADDLATRLCDGLGVLFAALLFFFQIRHALNGGDPFAPTSGHVEQGLFALTSLGFAAVLTRLDVARGNPIFRAASLIFGVISGAVILIGLGLAENPLFAGDPVRGPILFSTLVLAYLLPGLAAMVLVYFAHGTRPDWYVNGATALGLALLFGYAALEIRHAFQGESLLITLGTSAPELGLITLTGLAFAAALIRLDVAHPDPALRAASLVFGGLSAAAILLGLGLRENPLFTGELVRGPVIFNALVPAYLLPGLAAMVLAHFARGVRPDWYVNGATALGLALLFGYAALEIRHAFQGESLLLARGTSAPEVGLITLTGLAFAVALIRLDGALPDPALRGASLVFGVLSAAAILLGLGLVENPLFTGELVRGPVLLNALVPAYLLPSLAAIVLARVARGVRPDWYVTGAAALAVLLIFGYVTLEVRHAFQGERLLIGQSTGAPEVWSYSVAWLALGLAFLFYGLWRGSTEARLASAALVVLTVLKVFLYDLMGIGGFWRAFSVICLGAVLIGIGLVYQKFVFARPQASSGR